ncbi:MAG: winged helix-turn-helix transcriptional regulator, partial [Planctomycetota bacterium]
WMLLIILELYKGSNHTRRFSDLRDSLDGITPKVLSERLKELEDEGILTRNVDATAFPIRSEYTLTESGLEIVARPPGKELRNLSLLSGGEKTMTALALLFSIFRAKPSPFCLLDEVDAALDEANTERFGRLVQEYVSESQFIVVSHAKRTMSMANVLYGVTMQEPGVSTRVSVRFEDAHKFLDKQPQSAEA